MTPLSFILEVSGASLAIYLTRERLLEYSQQMATSIQVTAEHQCLLQTLRPHQPARKSFPDLCVVVTQTQSGRSGDTVSSDLEVRCPPLALTVLLTCGTLEINPHLSGEVFIRRKK